MGEQGYGATGHQARTRRVAFLLVAAGLLWILYGPFTMLQPWGTDVAYDEAKGYSVILDVGLFRAYGLPGALALVLSAAGLLGLTPVRRSGGLLGRGTRLLTYVALALGLVSLVGLVALFDPAFTAGRVFGTVALGGAAVLASLAARRGGPDRTWVWGLLVLGAVGLLLLPLWPVVHALRWLPPGGGAVVIALFGLGWLWAGWRVRAEAAPAPVAGRPGGPR